MAELITIDNERLTNILRSGKYDPLIYLNSLDGIPKTPQAKSAYFEIPTWAAAISAHLDDDEAGPDVSIAPNMLIEKTEVFFVHDAFINHLHVGINFETDHILKAIKYVIETSIGEDPEGCVYIWCPVSMTHNSNFHTLLTSLHDLVNEKKRDIILLLEKL